MSIDWHKEYLLALSAPEKFCLAFSRYFFTFGSAIIHAIVYACIMNLEGGDFHLFLDGISIEAVFVSIFIGIAQNTAAKREQIAQLQRDHMQDTIEALIRSDTVLTAEIHKVVVPPKDKDNNTIGRSD